MTAHLQDLLVEIGLQAESKFELSSSSDSEHFTKPRVFAAGPMLYVTHAWWYDQVLLLDLSVQLEGHRRNGKSDRDLFLRSDRRTSILVVVSVLFRLCWQLVEMMVGAVTTQKRAPQAIKFRQLHNVGLCHM